MNARHRHVVPTAAFLAVFGCGQLGAQGCPLPPLEPPIPDVGAPPLAADDVRLLDDFGAALARFRGMSVDELLRELGPEKAYRTGGPLPFAFIRGDANGDREVDLSDAVCTLFYLFLSTGAGPCSSPGCLDPHDVDDSGAVEITDAIRLLQHLFLGGPPPAPPFPAPGADRTADDLACAAVQASDLDYDPLDSEYLDAIVAAYPLTIEQEAAFREHGFVVLDDRPFDTVVWALYDVFHRHLPVYFSVDALLDALHLSFDAMLKSIEEELLVHELERMLSAMDGGIDGLAANGAGESELEDVSLWLCVARSLLAGEKVPCSRPVDARVEELLAQVAAEACVAIEVFGHDHVEDFSQFKPRSHYTETAELRRYFRAMMWIQRIGMKFAQIPRHAAAAYLLSRLLEETDAIAHWRVIDEVVRTFVGTADSLDAPGMLELAVAAEVESVADLRGGDGFLRLVRRALETGAGRQLILSQLLHADPYAEDFTPIPPAFHLMGQRFIADSSIFTNVVFDRVPDRRLPSPLDAWFVLGNRAALPLLEPEIRFYGYQTNLAALDWILSRYPDDFWSSSLYNTWLSALQALSADTTGARYPQAMQTEAWDRRMLHAQLASWAHLRHDTLLYAKPSYGAVPCFYPDGWIDPYPEFYARIAAFAEGAIPRLEALGILDLPRGDRTRTVLEAFSTYSRKLEEIARAELAGEELSTEQLELIRSILKPVLWGDGCEEGTPFEGWYFDLIFDEIGPPGSPDRDVLQSRFAPTIADVHTDPLSGRVLHVGVGKPNLLLLSVNNDCGTKAYVGPALSYYEVVRDGLHRMTDSEWEAALGGSPPRPEWVYEFVR